VQATNCKPASWIAARMSRRRSGGMEPASSARVNGAISIPVYPARGWTGRLGERPLLVELVADGMAEGYGILKNPPGAAFDHPIMERPCQGRMDPLAAQPDRLSKSFSVSL